jgi:ketosteroid isomerase-like protein
VTSETDPATDEPELRRLIDELGGALRAHDLDAAMSIYATDVVSFDIEPPLQHVGGHAKRKNWERVFAAYECPLNYEVRELAITVGEDVAFAHSLNRLSGTLRNGAESPGFWVRATMCFRKFNGRWAIAHDQVSVPLDMATGAALVNLAP